MPPAQRNFCFHAVTYHTKNTRKVNVIFIQLPALPQSKRHRRNKTAAAPRPAGGFRSRLAAARSEYCLKRKSDCACCSQQAAEISLLHTVGNRARRHRTQNQPIGYNRQNLPAAFSNGMFSVYQVHPRQQNDKADRCSDAKMRFGKYAAR